MSGQPKDNFDVIKSLGNYVTPLEELVPDLAGAQLESVAMLREQNPIRWITTDLLSRRIHRKRLQELLLYNANDHRTYSAIKLLGIFSVNYAWMRANINDEETGFQAKEKDRYLSMHVMPLPPAMRSGDVVDASFARIAQYMQQHRIKVPFIGGGTNYRLAELAVKRYDFKAFQPNPQIFSRGTRRIIAKDSKKYSTRGNTQVKTRLPVFVYKRTEQFLHDHLPDEGILAA